MQDELLAAGGRGAQVARRADVIFQNADAAGLGIFQVKKRPARLGRNPLTGEALPYGEYLPRAQGEDVVSGKFTPLALEAMLEAEPEAHAAACDHSKQASAS